MLKPENRLKKVRDFNLLMSHGQWVNGHFLDLKYLDLAKIKQFYPKKEDPEDFAKQLKIAFTVGLKLSKKAVKRNRLRRLMREAARLFIKEDSLRKGYYCLFVARPGSLQIDFEQAQNEVGLLLKKAKIYKK